jgi:predicted O-methyltransferase YrrM
MEAALPTLEKSGTSPSMKLVSFLRRVRASRLGLALNMPRRLFLALRQGKPLFRTLVWVVASREDTNYTYDITDRSIQYLAHAISIVTGTAAEEALKYMREAQSDSALREHVIQSLREGPYRYHADARCDFGRRLGWYALVRILKPSVVVETGVDKGLGSALLCAALLRNGSGRLFATDINVNAGFLLSGPYASAGTILYGDSIESLRRIEGPIGLFINDSDHSGEYELAEYEAVQNKLSDGAVVVGDNAQSSSVLMRWSELTGRRFLYWAEEPNNHWYAGSGIGFSFK